MTEQTATQTVAPAVRTCRCGCGHEVQGKKSIYRPGHDARHAGRVARLTLDRPTDEHEFDLIEALPSAALRTKAMMMHERLAAKRTNGTTRLNRKAKEAGFERPQQQAVASLDRIDEGEVREVKGTVKIGRWEYPARNLGGQVWRNEARDGSGEWVPAPTEKFTVNA